MVSRETLKIEAFFDLSGVWFSRFMTSAEQPWDLLKPGLKEKWIEDALAPNVAIVERAGTLVLKTVELRVPGGSAVVEAGSCLVGNRIELRAGVVVEAGAWITGPTILGEGTLVRQGAYIRGGVITGTKAIIGHASEVKSSIFLNDAKAPHFAYVGDSILGNRVNLGAGTKISNLKITNTEVRFSVNGEKVSTGLRKMGAILGDGTETGCNSVLNPGVLLGKNCRVYPAIAVRPLYYPDGTMVR
ncbi:MAG: glucose-1-phosphate thymidylyltransferase [Pseudomonadota bacterium]